MPRYKFTEVWSCSHTGFLDVDASESVVYTFNMDPMFKKTEV